MRTISRHRPSSSPRGDYQAECDYCGAMWYRSRLVKDGAGLLACPDDRRGRDVVTLSRQNAAHARAHRPAPPPYRGGQYHATPYDFRTSVDVVAYYRASSGVELASGGEVASVQPVFGGTRLLEPGAFGLTGTGPGYLSSSTAFSGEPAFLGDAVTGTVLVSPHEFWGEGDYPWCFFVGQIDDLTDTSAAIDSDSFTLRVNDGQTQARMSYMPGISSIFLGDVVDTEPHLFELGVLDDVLYLLVDGVEHIADTAGPISLLQQTNHHEQAVAGRRTGLFNDSWKGSWAAAMLVRNATSSGLAEVRAELRRVYGL